MVVSVLLFCNFFQPPPPTSTMRRISSDPTLNVISHSARDAPGLPRSSSVPIVQEIGGDAIPLFVIGNMEADQLGSTDVESDDGAGAPIGSDDDGAGTPIGSDDGAGAPIESDDRAGIESDDGAGAPLGSEDAAGAPLQRASSAPTVHQMRVKTVLPVSDIDDGAHIPLLATHDHGRRSRQSYIRAIFNVVTSIIGAGIMSLPVAFRILGIIPAILLIISIGIVVQFSVEFMLRSNEVRTYSRLLNEYFGSLGSVSVRTCVVISNLGALILFLIIIGDVLCGTRKHSGIVNDIFGIQWWDSRELTLFIVVVVLLPLVMYRHIESLWLSSVISTALAVLFLAAFLIRIVIALVQGTIEIPRLLPEWHGGASFLTVFTAIPVIVTAFTFHFNVHAIRGELDKPTDMICVVSVGLMICAAIYIAIGMFGYLLFGDLTKDDVLVNFDQHSDWKVINIVVQLTYALHMLFTFPLLNFSLRSSVDEFLFSGWPSLEGDNRRFMVTSVLLLLLTYTVAIAIPSIVDLFQFLGSTSAVFLVFIFPAAVAMRDIHDIFSSRDRIIATIMIILAVITMFMVMSTNMYKYFAK